MTTVSTTQTTGDGLDLPFVLSSWRIVSDCCPSEEEKGIRHTKNREICRSGRTREVVAGTLVDPEWFYKELLGPFGEADAGKYLEMGLSYLRTSCFSIPFCSGTLPREFSSVR